MENISEYLKGSSRNKIILHKETIKGVTSIDVGKTLSKIGNRLLENKTFALKLKDQLDKEMSNSVYHLEPFGKVLAIENLGILFQKELDLDFLAFIDKNSRDKCLFIKWEGQINNNELFFLNEESGIKINIKNLSHIII